MSTNLIEQALEALNLIQSEPLTQDDLLAFVNQWKQFVEKAKPTDYVDADLEAWKVEAQAALESSDEGTTLRILKAVSDDPMLGIALVALIIPSILLRAGTVGAWWGLHFAEQRDDGNIYVPNGEEPVWRVKNLPPPSEDRKYLIVSDIHRDSAADGRAPFETGAIDHFTANRELYLRLLEYAEEMDYTVIEGGDCEELWFIGETRQNPSDTEGFPVDAQGDLDIGQKMQETVETHAEIYAKLASLHLADRYVRVQGNHDSFLKGGPSRSVLNTAMGHNDSNPFPIYDACVIQDVKTMREGGFSDIWDEVVAHYDTLTGDSDGTKAQEIANFLVNGRLGMDADDYTDKCAFMICHGHQFDFWNSPENEILGMLFSNTLGTTTDMMMDPLVQAGGVAWQGNPYIDFNDFFATHFPFSSWLSKSPAIAYAHSVKHMPNGQRMPSDSAFYHETIPAVWGALGLSLAKVSFDSDGQITFGALPAESRENLDFTSLDSIQSYLGTHCYNHICLGHTHNPHSQPYFRLGNLATLVYPYWSTLNAMVDKFDTVAGWFNDAVAVPNYWVGTNYESMPTIVPEIPGMGLLGKAANLFSLKTGYFNSGTAGWMEGVIWAIEIDATGQARLVYWTEDSLQPKALKLLEDHPELLTDENRFKELGIKPEYMDWELQPMDPVLKQALTNNLSRLLDGVFSTVDGKVSDIQNALQGWMSSLQGQVDAVERRMQQALALPIEILGGAMMLTDEKLDELGIRHRKFDLKEFESNDGDQSGDANNAIRRSLEGKLSPLRDFSADVMLAVKRRALTGFSPGSEETVTIKAPLPDGGRAMLDSFKKIVAPVIASAVGLDKDKDDPNGLLPILSGQQDQAAYFAAALNYAIFSEFPRSLPFFDSMEASIDPAMRALRKRTPVLGAFLSALWMYPIPGSHIDVGYEDSEDKEMPYVRITSRLTVDDEFVDLTITLSDSPDEKPPPPPTSPLAV